MFSATVFGSEEPLVISSAVVERVLEIVSSTEDLYAASPEELVDRLRSYSRDGLITRARFGSLFPRLPLSLFEIFDRTDSGSCDVIELAIGLSIFCQGSKSTKLALAFDLLDDDNDGELTRRGLWRFIHSFLAALLTVGQFFAADATKKDIARILDRLSVATASEILATGKGQKISFHHVSDWYAQRGCRDSSWLELLDIRKWIPVQRAVSQREAEREDEEEDDEDDEDDDENDDDDERYVYSAALLGQHSLLIKASDTARVFAVSRASGLDSIDSSDLVSLLREYEGPDGCIQAINFQHFLQNFIELEDMAPEIRNGLSTTLFHIFRTFEENSNCRSGGADIECLSMGLALFCAGNKSNKLGTGFSVFDVQQVGYLTKSELSSFLSSILLVLTALGSIEHASVAVAAATYVTNEICKSTGSDTISFGAFGEWCVTPPPPNSLPLPLTLFLALSPKGTMRRGFRLRAGWSS